MVNVHKKTAKQTLKTIDQPHSFRPSVRFLERIGKHLTGHLNKHSLLSIRQFGFRKELSSADLHLFMMSAWSEALDHELSTCTSIIPVDIEGTYDRVWHSVMVEKLRAVGVEGKLLLLLKDYLSNRQFRVVCNGKHSSQKNIGADVPQGSVLDPLTWNIFINDLFRLVPETRVLPII